MTLSQRIFEDIYRRAPRQDALPWHREEPPSLLKRAVERKRASGRALDLGCGEGVSSVYLAQNGYSVVGVDFVSAALELARARARTAGVSVDFVQGDVTAYQSPETFDLVLDSGCLHHIGGEGRRRYRAKLDGWLKPGGDFVLVHFSKRHALDWRPVGPRRWPKKRIVELFAPLRLQEYEETWFDLGMPIGRSLAGVYWFG